MARSRGLAVEAESSLGKFTLGKRQDLAGTYLENVGDARFVGVVEGAVSHVVIPVAVIFRALQASLWANCRSFRLPGTMPEVDALMR